MFLSTVTLILQRFDATCCYEECLVLSRTPVLLKKVYQWWKRLNFQILWSFIDFLHVWKINEVVSYVFFAHVQVIIQCTMQGQFNQRGQEINIILLTVGALNLEWVHETSWNKGKLKEWISFLVWDAVNQILLSLVLRGHFLSYKKDCLTSTQQIDLFPS